MYALNEMYICLDVCAFICVLGFGFVIFQTIARLKAVVERYLDDSDSSLVSDGSFGFEL